MDLMSIFSGDPAKHAADQQRRFFEDTRLRGEADLDRTLQQNLATARMGYGGARDDAIRYTDSARNYLTGGRDQALGFVDAGTADARSVLDRARGDVTSLSDLAGRYRTGADMYSNALGLNGPQGNQTAVGAFQAGPGYDFALDQGLDAISRRRNAVGMLDSGNADRDAQTFGMGMANQEYSNWLGRLQGYQPLELQATQGANQTLANLGLAEAGMLNTAGTNKAGIASGTGLNLANITSGLGTTLGNVNIGEANTLAGLNERSNAQRLGLSQNNAQPYAKTYGDEAMAEMAGAKNAWGLGLNLASLAASANFGGSPLSSLFGGVGGGGMAGVR